MKLLSVISLFIALFATSLSFAQNGDYRVLFTPHEGREAFGTVYGWMKKARKSVKVTVYSWSDTDLNKALRQARKNGAQVRVILHPPLYEDKANVQNWVDDLEKVGVEFKLSYRLTRRGSSPKNMHEKFVIVDGKYLSNSSANFSRGARTRYSEAFVLYTNPPEDLLYQFQREFALIWDTSKDIFTRGEEAASPEGFLKMPAIKYVNQDSYLFSSSRNFSYTATKSKAQQKEGLYVQISNKRTWVVRDMMLKAFSKAEKNIKCNLNHLFLRPVKDGLVEAAKRGIDVSLVVDNQEFKSSALTRQFVRDWTKLRGKANQPIPVRVKFYSFAPSPHYWLLNHHKTCTVDIDDGQPLSPAAAVISGSYNISKTAEHLQYDNMVLYRGESNLALMKAFDEEFENLWYFNRRNDQAPWSRLKRWLNPRGNVMNIHSSRAYSLTWEEAEELKEMFEKKAPDFRRSLYRDRDLANCRSYDLRKKRFLSCPSN